MNAPVKRRRLKRTRVSDWTAALSWARAFKTAGAGGLVMYQESPDGTYQAFAFTSPKLDDFLDDHAHKHIGVYKSESAARRACNRWLKRLIAEANLLEACGCKEIRPPELVAFSDDGN